MPGEQWPNSCLAYLVSCKPVRDLVLQNKMEWLLRLSSWLHTQVYAHTHTCHTDMWFFCTSAASTSIRVWLTIVTYTAIILPKKYMFNLVIKFPGSVSEFRAPSWLFDPLISASLLLSGYSVIQGLNLLISPQSTPMLVFFHFLAFMIHTLNSDCLKLSQTDAFWYFITVLNYDWDSQWFLILCQSYSKVLTLAMSPRMFVPQ